MFFVGFFLFLLIPKGYANKSSTDESDKGHFITAGYEPLTEALFKDGKGKVSGIEVSTFESKLQFTPGYSIGYEYRNSPQRAWGKAFGVLHSLRRDLVTVDTNGEKSDVSGSDVDTIAITSLYSSAIYKIEHFFFSIGANYSHVDYSPHPDSDVKIKSNGTLGFNLGLGWQFNDHIILECSGRNNLWNLKMTEGELEADFGYGHLAIASLLLKVRFY